MRSAFITALVSAARRDKNLWLLTADLGYSFLEKFAQEFPDRFVNVGVAEQNLMSVAAGLALAGKKVVVYSIINFATFRCLEQIRLDICYHKLDVSIVGVGAGYFYGAQGYSHHCVEDLALMRALPHLEIYVPIDAVHTQWLVGELMLRSGPKYLRLGRQEESMQVEKYTLQGFISLLAGEDVVILTMGEDAIKALHIAHALRKKGIEAGVVACMRLKPFDKEKIAFLAASRAHLVVIETHGVGGLGSLCAEVMVSLSVCRPLQVFQLPASPVEVGGDAKELLEGLGMSVEAITEAILQKCV